MGVNSGFKGLKTLKNVGWTLLAQERDQEKRGGKRPFHKKV